MVELFPEICNSSTLVFFLFFSLNYYFLFEFRLRCGAGARVDRDFPSPEFGLPHLIQAFFLEPLQGTVRKCCNRFF